MKRIILLASLICILLIAITITTFESKKSLPITANYENNDESKVDPFNAILQKYIGKEKVNALYSKISEELIGKNPQELSEYSQSQNELFNLLAQMLETKELTANEQEILKDGLKIIDISKLTNSKTVETINSFMAK